MPKIGMEPLRRRELIDAAIRTIGQRGSLDVTVAQIAHEAGVSPALAHHYFGGKDKLILATMRHLLRELGRDLNAAIKQANTPHERIAAIIAVNFSAAQFAQETIAAWLTFYVHAQQSDDIKRLLRIYARRLHSNLVFALEQLTSRARANRIAEGAGAMIDGLYIRHALGADVPDAASAIALVEDYIAIQLSGQPSAEN
ncbi:transcriptional regulator BetI [Brucella suis]|uniref:HTH-type transcriptional regulator BetI n=1 Tax=Brucella suis (strain ATCC 23445 / NCTC 10510) TaxID=470137 RepID=BETI_BRUSI|nr:transcriptional regulator BetI [Brucella suis]B0CKN5.1 RecName: Full=HTH-type transcriptional regulator BetI [Brucella suis ATCC 23445]ABY37665.1 HTH-type transcriptional regulator betI [Brucella suis ATCC 23445]ENR22480.1 HTH-type transcriptional regulator BetI [Brucella suis 92/63]ENR27795.1 HTH-type transcriptional regulator BetI [Brucella suis 94/11]ENR36166.1 HTH-type transcriptional regulator BetI [Brucella suis F4/06-146]ENR36691.1 HTH-type transcriptional regulator BetI [Brucella s